MKHNKKSSILKNALKVSSIVLASVMLIGSMPHVGADGEPSKKEEVIYADLTADGGVEEVYAVNIFKGGDVVDYGNYSELELLNTTDSISHAGDKITFSTTADRVYYKGKIDEAELPWNIAVKYILDGTELTSDEVAGKNGKLKINISITKNDSCMGNFFEVFTLQMSVVLDTENCSNITADGATVANMGRNKQLTYIILPGRGADITIFADVTNFEMESISVNGLKMGINIEIDDESINSKINEIIGAVKELDSGAGELNTGAADLSSGLSAIADKNEELINGAYQHSKACAMRRRRCSILS